jgi:hypothetical protein
MKEEPKGTELNRKQRESIPYLIGARSLEEGRKRARVGKATLYKWLRDETFKKELEQAREQMIKAAVDSLKTSITTAVEGLIDLMGNEDGSLKLRACTATLEFFLKIREAQDFENRLAALEKAVAERR